METPSSFFPFAPGVCYLNSTSLGSLWEAPIYGSKIYPSSNWLKLGQRCGQCVFASSLSSVVGQTESALAHWYRTGPCSVVYINNKSTALSQFAGRFITLANTKALHAHAVGWDAPMCVLPLIMAVYVLSLFSRSEPPKKPWAFSSWEQDERQCEYLEQGWADGGLDAEESALIIKFSE